MDISDSQLFNLCYPQEEDSHKNETLRNKRRGYRTLTQIRHDRKRSINLMYPKCHKCGSRTDLEHDTFFTSDSWKICKHCKQKRQIIELQNLEIQHLYKMNNIKKL